MQKQVEEMTWKALDTCLSTFSGINCLGMIFSPARLQTLRSRRKRCRCLSICFVREFQVELSLLRWISEILWVCEDFVVWGGTRLCLDSKDVQRSLWQEWFHQQSCTWLGLKAQILIIHDISGRFRPVYSLMLHRKSYKSRLTLIHLYQLRYQSI